MSHIEDSALRALILRGVGSGDLADVVSNLNEMTMSELSEFGRDLDMAAALANVVRRRRAHDEWHNTLRQAQPSKEDQP